MQKLLSDFNELVMFKHSVFSLPFILIAMIVGSENFFGFDLLVLGILSAVFARNFAMAFNRYLDADIDVLNPRTKDRPSVDGRLDSKKIIIFVFLNAFLFVLCAYFINQLAFYLATPVLLILASYSYFKRFSFLAHFVLGISLGLAPIAGVIAVSESVPLWSIYLSIGVIFWVAGFDLLYSLQDIEFDKNHSLHSVPSIFGHKKTLFISRVSHILTVIFWLFFVIEAKLDFFGYFAVFISVIMLSYEHYLVNRDFTKIDRAFFTVNGYLGIVFFILVTIDEVMYG